MKTKKVVSFLLIAFMIFYRAHLIAQGSTPIIPSLSANSGATSALPSGGGFAPDSRGWTDPALNHNRLLRDRIGEGVYVLIGPYKVKGSPYLYGPGKNGDIYSQNEKAYNIRISYNTYNQEVEFYSTSNPSQPLVKEPGDIDSFMLKKNIDEGIPADVLFVYAKHLGSSEKSYFQMVETGDKYNLLKRYKSDLGIPSANYSQPDVRQFDLLVDYYYYDVSQKKIKKIKANRSSLIKEFKGVKDISSILDNEAFSHNPEAEMKKAFIYLNK